MRFEYRIFKSNKLVYISILFYSKARRHFLFDVHQQSCDKTLRKLVPEFVAKIRDKLNTDALLEELRSPSQLSAQQKIEIWQKLKVI